MPTIRPPGDTLAAVAQEWLKAGRLQGLQDKELETFVKKNLRNTKRLLDEIHRSEHGAQKETE